MDGGKNMLVEIFLPSEGPFCMFEPTLNVPYRLVHMVEAHATTLQETLDWTRRYANNVQACDPWVKSGLRSSVVGEVFLVKFANI
jgi:hypothetical protein